MKPGTLCELDAALSPFLDREVSNVGVTENIHLGRFAFTMFFCTVAQAGPTGREQLGSKFIEHFGGLWV
jgi:hypothetical protein